MAPNNALFTRNIELKLIEEVRQRPLLWDTTLDTYRRTDLKRQHWDEIAIILGPEFTGEMVTKRFNNMESTFRSNERKVKNSERSGKGTDDLFTPSWEYYKMLTFLRKTCVQAENTDNLTTESSSDQQSSFSLDTCSNASSAGLSECGDTPFNMYYDENLQQVMMIPQDMLITEQPPTPSATSSQGTISSTTPVFSVPSVPSVSGRGTPTPLPRPSSAPPKRQADKNILFSQRGVKQPRQSVSLLKEAVDAVSDTLKLPELAEKLREVRKLSRKLRSQNNVQVLKALKLPVPLLDCETRWSSTHAMVKSLLPLEEFCREHPNSHMMTTSKDFFEELSKVEEALEPAKTAVTCLQAEQLVMGDLLGAWTKCKLQTTQIGTPIDLSLVAHMDAREGRLFTNPAFAAAVYLDPRYFTLLDTNSAQMAEIHLLKLWLRLEKIKADQKPPEQPPHVQQQATGSLTTETTPSEGDNDEDTELEELLREKDEERLVGQTANKNILPLLQTFRSSPRISTKDNVLNFSERNKYAMPELYELSVVALAVPATQVSVERLFSGLKFVMSDLRYNLSSATVDNLMVIRTNSLFTKNTHERLEREEATSSSISFSSSTSTVSPNTSAVFSDGKDITFGAIK